MTLRELLWSGEEFLKERGVADASTDAWLLLEYVTGLSRAQYLAQAEEPISSEDLIRCYRELLEQRGRHIPLQHLTGEQEFMGLPFLVNEHVLIPRQDTETLVEEALKRLRPGMRVLDLCTGSGCIAVSLAKLGADASIDASDISPKALAVARENARRLGAWVHFIESDLFAKIGGKKKGNETDDPVEEAESDATGETSKAIKRNDTAGRYDMIVSNPPYIRTAVIGELAEEVRLHEPIQALDGSEDGLRFYREIILQSPAHLTDGGRLLFEIGYDQAEAVRGLMSEAGFTEIEVIRDLAGHDRVIVGKIKT